MKKLQNSYGLRRMLGWVLGLSMLAAVAGCGGSAGAGAQGGAGNAAGASNASSITLITDKSSLKADGTQTATLTAFVKDGNNNVLPKQPISFSTGDASSAITPGASPLVTDAGGKATATLDVGASNVNRTVTVTATTGSISQTLTVPVTGTSITVAGAPTLALGVSSPYTVTLRNAAGTALTGVTISLLSGNGNVISATRPVTDASGQALFSVAGTNTGADTLTSSVLGASGQMAISVAAPATVSGISFSPSTANVPVNTATPLTVTYTVGSVPQAGRQLTLTLTRGTFVSTGTPTMTATTDGSGQATLAVTSPIAGSSTVTAVDSGDSTVTSAATLTFFSGPANAAKITLSPSITSVGVNLAGSSLNKSTLTAVVRDAADNPVSGATVAFSALIDPSGGGLSPATAVTDATGTATSSFIAGANPTGFNGVTLQAIVATAPSVAAQAQLTVAQVALYVDLGTGNTLLTKDGDSTIYIMPWSAIVTDSSRSAVVGATVSVSLTAVRYLKGVWKFGTAWYATRYIDPVTFPGTDAPTACLNEDVNNNNILDAGEDKNGSGKLEAGSPASVQVDSVTAADGTAAVKITYPRSFGSWVEVTLRATISTSGTESSVERTFVLPSLSADLNSATVSPPNIGRSVVVNSVPFLTGPYGYDPTKDGNGFCTNPN